MDSSTLKILADENIAKSVVLFLRSRKIDVATVAVVEKFMTLEFALQKRMIVVIKQQSGSQNIIVRLRTVLADKLV